MFHVAYPVRFSLALIALLAYGCGGAQSETDEPDEAPEEPESEDLVFDEYEPVDIGGTVFQPEGMVQAPDANIRGPERQKAWNEGRKKYQEGDLEGSVEAYESLLELYPDGAPDPVKTWVASIYLRDHQNDAAAELVADHEPENEDLRGHQAYVAAWTAFRQGELDRARDFIAAAAQKWPSQQGQRAVVNDIVLMTARAATPLEKAHELITEITGGDVQQTYVLMFRLHEQYVFAGHYDLASNALEHIQTVVLEEQELPHEDAVGFGYRRSDYEFRMGRPGEAARLAIEAYEGLEDCGEACEDGTAEAVTQRLSDLARVFHTAYATSLDEKFYEPAVSLYETYVEIPDREDTETVQGYLSNLEKTHENAVSAQGKHDAQVMDNVVKARREAIQACYEESLGWDPDLGGELTLTIEIDQAGEVTEVSTDPEESEEGLGRVATCAAERAAGWSFPARSVEGTTTLEYPFALSTQADAAPEDATTGPGEASKEAPESDAAEG